MMLINGAFLGLLAITIFYLVHHENFRGGGGGRGGGWRGGWHGGWRGGRGSYWGNNGGYVGYPYYSYYTYPYYPYYPELVTQTNSSCKQNAVNSYEFCVGKRPEKECAELLTNTLKNC